MRNWDVIIQRHEKAGAITPDEADELREFYDEVKTAGLVSGIGKSVGQGFKKSKELAKSLFGTAKDTASNVAKGMSQTPTGQLLLLGGGAAITKELAEAAYEPMKKEMQYKAMKEQLLRISPSTLNESEETLRTTYNLVKHYAPVMAENPITAAIAVRDSIDLPSQTDVTKLRTLTEIQRNRDQAAAAQNRRSTLENIGKHVKTITGLQQAAEGE